MSLEWNILNKLFPGRKVPRGRTESAVPPLDSTLALLLMGSAGIVVWRSVLTLRIRLVGQRPFLMMKIIKTIAISWLFEYTICNRVARSLFGIGDQAETCAQLFYVKE